MKITAICPECGVEFHYSSARYKSRRYCSDACRYVPPEVRFWRNVVKSDGCWEWSGTISGKGYGIFHFKVPIQRSTGAHRFCYEMHFGPVPDDLYVMHTCDNRKCVRPSHLKIGTPAENTADMMSKGRNRPPRGEGTTQSKVTDLEVAAIRALYRNGGMGYLRIAQRFGISTGAVFSIVTGATWAHLPGALPSGEPRPPRERSGIGRRGEPRRKLNEGAVREIREAHASGEGGYGRLAKAHGVSTTAIQQVVQRKTWRHVA